MRHDKQICDCARCRAERQARPGGIEIPTGNDLEEEEEPDPWTLDPLTSERKETTMPAEPRKRTKKGKGHGHSQLER